MSIRIAEVAVAAVAVWSCLAHGAEPEPSKFDQDATRWVGDALLEIETVKVGMTRAQLLTVFGMEGGLSSGLRRTYVYRRCPIIKVDFEFDAVGRPSRDAEGRVTLIESDQDIITKMSRPYLARSVID
ncbi:MAG TPA: hypothetical protein VH814_09710 [Steroidobacteraceae bacterium]|jgi:hypothetical protein